VANVNDKSTVKYFSGEKLIGNLVKIYTVYIVVIDKVKSMYREDFCWFLTIQRQIKKP